MICTPIGSPVSVRPIGATVAGSPAPVAGPAQMMWFGVGLALAVDVEAAGAHLGE